jgi:hypothetical protein
MGSRCFAFLASRPSIRVAVLVGFLSLGIGHRASGVSFLLAAQAADSEDTTLSAVVDANGQLIRGLGAKQAERRARGQYSVVFDRDVRNYSFMATVGSPDQGTPSLGMTSVARRQNNPNGVFVQTADKSGNLADLPFHLIVSPASDTTPISNIPSTGTPGIARTVLVKVSRHQSVSLSDAEANQILSDMSTVLQKLDFPTNLDTEVSIQFVLDGSVEVLPATLPSAVVTPQDMATYQQLRGIKVVRDIQVCGTTVTGAGASIIGCSPVPSTFVNEVVMRIDPGQEGILWVHEFGHNCGLNHRTDLEQAVMNPFVGPDHKVVSSSEAFAYLGGPQAAVVQVAAALKQVAAAQQQAAVAGNQAAQQGQAQAAQQESPQRPKDIKQFVRRYYPEGVPFDLARQYPEQDGDVLVQMLKDPMENEQFLPNIVTTLCYLGREKDVETLINFVKDPKRPSTNWVFKAQKAALMGLGEVANKTKSEAAVNFLQAVMTRGLDENPAVQAARAHQRTLSEAAALSAGPNKVVPPSAQELASELAVSATMGLGHSGLPQAEAALSALAQQSAPAFQRAKSVAPQAQRINQESRTPEGHARMHHSSH